MTQEEKAKAYDEALEKARIFRDHLSEIDYKDFASEIEYIFPVLKESEDEKIRKEIISLVLKALGREKDNLNDENYDKMLAWLEKQGEQKSMLSKDEQYTLARIIESLEDDGCPTEWLTLLNDIYSMFCQKSTEWTEEDDKNLAHAEYACMKFFGGDTGLIDWLNKIKKRMGE